MRTDNLIVAAVVRQFIDSKRADAWYLLGDGLRDALIDQAVMDHVRLSNEDKPITPRELIAFRDAIEEKLATHKTRPMLLESRRADERELKLRETIKNEALRALGGS